MPSISGRFCLSSMELRGMVGCLLEDKTMTARLAILFYLVKSKRKNIIVPQRLIISALVIEK